MFVSGQAHRMAFGVGLALGCIAVAVVAIGMPAGMRRRGAKAPDGLIFALVLLTPALAVLFYLLDGEVDDARVRAMGGGFCFGGFLWALIAFLVARRIVGQRKRLGAAWSVAGYAMLAVSALAFITCVALAVVLVLGARESATHWSDPGAIARATLAGAILAGYAAGTVTAAALGIGLWKEASRGPQSEPPT